MAQRVKVPAVKTGDMSSAFGTHVGVGDMCISITHTHTHTHTDTHTQM